MNMVLIFKRSVAQYAPSRPVKQVGLKSVPGLQIIFYTERAINLRY